jgi:hypothetical protein
MIHDMDISKWPDATCVKWSARIDQTPTMERNQKVVGPANVTSQNAKLVASSHIGANVTKQELTSNYLVNI